MVDHYGFKVAHNYEPLALRYLLNPYVDTDIDIDIYTILFYIILDYTV